VYEPDVMAIRHRMPCRRRVTTRRVVLDVDHWNRRADAAVQPLDGQLLFVRSLQHDDVDVGFR
jgi:hypothetical protein